jgi:hypothetical protein
MEREFALLLAADEGEEEPFLDPYGAEHPAEFFAVAVESFFTQPRELLQVHPELYGVLGDYFRQDPAREWRFVDEARPWPEPAQPLTDKGETP